MVISFLLAVTLNKKFAGRSLFRVILYLPAVSSVLAIGIVWKWMFNTDFGVINKLFHTNIQWLTSPKLVKISLIIKGVWGGLGGTMLLFLASLQNISNDYYEAADIEGANSFDKMFKITVPLVTPVTFYVIIIGVIGGLNAFSDNYIIAASDDANTVVYYMWRKLNQGEYGLVSAAAILQGAVCFIVTLIQFKFSSKWVYGEE
jgi:multiple sugar transport system permease protein